jgi:nucleoside-diphosphate-sugar epimerase
VKILVTGGAGKIGAYVVRELAAAHSVTVFDRAAPADAKDLRWIGGDIENFDEVLQALTGADAVVHLAGIPVPGKTVPDHVLFRINTLGTYNVHEACYRLGIKRIVSTSSGAILGWTYRASEFIPKYLPIDEDHPLNPHDPYGLSKLCGEEIARGYAVKCGMEAIALRPPWVQFPDAARQLREQGGRYPKRFDLCAYIDARDLAGAYRRAVEVPNLGHAALLIAADDSTAPEPLCELLPRLLPGLGEIAKTLTGQRPGVSNERAKRVLQWQPRYSWRRSE